MISSISDNLTMPWIFAVTAIFVLAILVVGHLIAKKDTGQRWHILGWYGWSGGFVLLFMTLLIIILFGNQQAVNQANRQSECRQKTLPSLLENPDNSMLDIKFILEKVCK